MDVERLIDEVRKYPVLYDTTHEKYRSAEHKEKIWKDIAGTLEARGGGEECKKRWAHTRDQLRKTLKKRLTPFGKPSRRHRKYIYEDLLDFLIPFLSERESLTAEDYYGEPEEVNSIDDFQDEDLTHALAEELDEDRKLFPAPRSPVSSKNVHKTGMKRKGELVDKAEELSYDASQLMTVVFGENGVEYPGRRLPGRASPDHGLHPVDAFLAGIAPTLKTLSPIRLNQAKTKIFAIVQDFEMQQLVAGEPGPYTEDPSTQSRL